MTGVMREVTLLLMLVTGGVQVTIETSSNIHVSRDNYTGYVDGGQNVCFFIVFMSLIDQCFLDSIRDC